MTIASCIEHTTRAVLHHMLPFRLVLGALCNPDAVQIARRSVE